MKRKTFLQHSLLFLGFATFKTNKLFGLYKASNKLFLNKVKFIWSGGVTQSSAKVHAGLTSATGAARLVVSTNPSLSNPQYGPYTNANSANNLVAPLSISGLTPNTEYYYGIEADGIIDTATDAIGKFKTVAAGPQSFRFTIASCNNSGNHPAWLRIKDKNPFIHITHGDFHYADPNSATDINVHRTPFENTLSQPAVKEFLQTAPIAYMWDDHDYCGDNTDSTAVGRTNARLAFQEYVPHFPLVAGSGDVPIYQAFTVGRVRFILTDLRSEKGAFGTSMMGAVQKAWFKNECLTAKNNNQQIIWISSVPWGPTVADAWSGYDAERTELSDFFKANTIINLMIICGDMHMLGIDNGTNHDFATGGNPNKYPVLQAAAVNQTGSYRGGTFSEGYFINPSQQFGQYMMLDIIDNGGSTIQFSITGFRVDNTGAETVMLTYAYTATMLSVLPITISKFAVKNWRQNGEKGAFLSWQLPGTGCRSMTVERSSNGLQFEPLHTISCTTATDYSYTDKQPLTGRNHYRIKLSGDNSNAVYSSVESIELAAAFSVQIQKSGKEKVHAIITSPANETSEYLVIDSHGQLVVKNTVVLNKGTTNLTVKMPVQSGGLYFFVLNNGNSKQVTEKFLIE